MTLARRTASVLGLDQPPGATPDAALGSALACALEAAGARMAAEGPVDLLVEATPLPRMGALAEPLTPIRLAQAIGPLADLPDEVARVRRGGAVLLVAALPAPAPRGWTALFLDWRRAYVAALAREMAPRGVRVNGLVALTGAARLPGFLAGGATPSGLATTAEVAEAALWLLAAPSVTGRTIDLGPL